METLLALLNITNPDAQTTTLLNLYLNKSQNTIKKRCNITDLTGLDDSVSELAAYYYMNRDKVGIKQMSQGSRSQTMESNYIPSDILANLPTPKVRMMG